MSLEEVKEQRVLTDKDLKKTYARWYLSVEVSNSYERLQALAFCNALSESLKKIYKDDEEGYKEALMRHLQFYNSEGTFGAVIHGVVLSMEEEKAKSKDESISEEVITGFKTGLMGPIAGIGDTLIWGTLKPIILALASSLALSGLFIGGLVPFLFPLAVILIGYGMLKSGYLLGKESVVKLMKSGLINNLINSASILGLFMMGALSSTYVKISTPLKFSFENSEPIVIQDILDQILVGILPIAAVFGIYFYFKLRGQYYNRLIMWLIVISLVTGFFGILQGS
ncbi:PTS system mannose/fructose/sorbose family transporter subunit IID [Ornithinibacillus gellani]|uniref:PTS system mannose/fructose/sorbose family transporter subunit IID n=1 Tax=Ornithinibacillus gellani TaxID=2293253 RepID=UPI000F499856|nr:PTS system mannose/fructose/sorbose family transporter subunit IID [Ornithinibacillus gellani]TQS71130.1 PTS system mannose/fructose/sorbose family transporter subunit IID [Ornithinibacillus gellani]